MSADFPTFGKMVADQFKELTKTDRVFVAGINQDE